MEAYEAMWSRVEEKDLNYVETVWINKVDGVYVCCNLSKLASGPTLMRLGIESEWTGDWLYEVKFRSATDIKAFVESVGRLRYDRSRDRLVCCACPSLAYDLLMMLPVVDNITTSYEDCSVCLEKCKTKTSCGHSLCQICESSLKPKVCPLCRKRYDHCLRDAAESMEDE
jgi:hypothetical protein